MRPRPATSSAPRWPRARIRRCGWWRISSASRSNRSKWKSPATSTSGERWRWIRRCRSVSRPCDASCGSGRPMEPTRSSLRSCASRRSGVASCSRRLRMRRRSRRCSTWRALQCRSCRHAARSWPIRRVRCRNRSSPCVRAILKFTSQAAALQRLRAVAAAAAVAREAPQGAIRNLRTGEERKRTVNHDLRGVPVTGADSFALARYETALGQFQTYVGDPIATIDEALQSAPAFIAGHLLKALVQFTLCERKFAFLSRDAVEAARGHSRGANARERGLLKAAELLVDGSWDRACQALDRVLVDNPRDALALQTAHLMDFYRGDAANLRNRVSRVLPHWDASIPGYSYVLGMHAFGLEEMNQYPEAEATALRALSIQPKDGWAVHAAVHVMEMQGRIDEGIAFLSSREADWAPDNGFAFHNFWHLALFHMDGARYR